MEIYNITSRAFEKVQNFIDVKEKYNVFDIDKIQSDPKCEFDGIFTDGLDKNYDLYMANNFGVLFIKNNDSLWMETKFLWDPNISVDGEVRGDILDFEDLGSVVEYDQNFGEFRRFVSSTKNIKIKNNELYIEDYVSFNEETGEPYDNTGREIFLEAQQEVNNAIRSVNKLIKSQEISGIGQKCINCGKDLRDYGEVKEGGKPELGYKYIECSECGTAQSM